MAMPLPRKFTAIELELLRDYVADPCLGVRALAYAMDRPEEEVRYAAAVLGLLPDDQR